MLEAQTLAARRGFTNLFTGLSFRVVPGEALVVTGANGTGKTTLLRILAGLSAPAAGEIRWNGTAVAPFDAELRSALAFVGHLPALKDDLTTDENLASLVALAGETATRRSAARRARRGRARRASARCPRACFRRASGGASASRGSRCSRRPLWILDEPATALDADGHATAGARSSPASREPRHSSSPPRTRRSTCPASRLRSLDARTDRPMSATAATATPTAPGAVWPAVRWAIARDLKLALRSRSELAVQLLFYVIVVSLFPLATSPERNLLSTMGPGVLWVAALLASLLSLPRLFAGDLADGTLEQIALSPYPLDRARLRQDRSRTG